MKEVGAKDRMLNSPQGVLSIVSELGLSELDG
jgi:hypothetical protein